MDINKSNPAKNRVNLNARVLNILLVIVILVLAYQNYQLKSDFKFKKPQTLNSGEIVSNLTLQDMLGNIIELNYLTDDESLREMNLLYFLSTQCTACEANLPNWLTIDSTFQSDDVNSYYVAVDNDVDLMRFYSDNNLRFKIYRPIDDDFETTYKITGVPLTVIVDQSGKVHYSYLGKLSLEELHRIQGVVKSYLRSSPNS